YITLVDTVKETGKEFDDIKMKLDTLTDLPQGAGPINFVKDFGDTAALMLTVASPRAMPAGVALRAESLRRAIEKTRGGSRGGTRVSIVYGLPASLSGELVRRHLQMFIDAATADGVLHDLRPVVGPGFAGVDGASDADDQTIAAYLDRFVHERLRAS